MTTSELYVLIITGVLGVLLVVVGFLIQGWMTEVKTAISENSAAIYVLAQKVIALETKINTGTDTMIAHNVEMKERVKQHVAFGIRTSTEKKITAMEMDIGFIKEIATKEILPRLDKHEKELGRVLPTLEVQKESLGRVIDLDKQVNEFEGKLLKMFKALEILVQKR